MEGAHLVTGVNQTATQVGTNKTISTSNEHISSHLIASLNKIRIS